MANYFTASILLGLWNFIDLISYQLSASADERWIHGIQEGISTFLRAGKPTILLTIYFVLLLFIVNKAHISIWRINQWPMRILLTALFLPCTVISILISIALAIYGNSIFDIEQLRTLASYFIEHTYIHKFIMLVPLRIILPWLITIIVATFVIRNDAGIVRKDIHIIPEVSNEIEIS